MKRYIKKRAQLVLAGNKLIPINKLFNPVFSGIGSIIMLHRVVESQNDIICDDLEVTADFLENMIQYFLQENYDIVSLDTVHDILMKKKEVKRKFVAFTFDDGYLDNYTVAYPIFKKYNVPFAVYVTTSFPDKHALLWWYALKDLIKSSQRIQFDFNEKKYNFVSEHEEQKEKAYKDIRNLILKTATEQQPKLFFELFDRNGIKLDKYTNQLTMNWNQVRELAHNPLVTIGAHTINHFNLKNLTADLAEKEIIESKNQIEAITGIKVEHFAFPFGTENEAGAREFEIAGKLEFKTSTTTRCGNIFYGHSAYTNCLPRITPSPYLMSSFPHYYASGFIPALKQKFRRLVTE